jgi:hypothetical protein
MRTSITIKKAAIILPFCACLLCGCGSSVDTWQDAGVYDYVQGDTNITSQQDIISLPKVEVNAQSGEGIEVYSDDEEEQDVFELSYTVDFAEDELGTIYSSQNSILCSGIFTLLCDEGDILPVMYRAIYSQDNALLYSNCIIVSNQSISINVDRSSVLTIVLGNVEMFSDITLTLNKGTSAYNSATLACGADGKVISWSLRAGSYTLTSSGGFALYKLTLSQIIY